ncbi:hypothetical protein O181_086490 [Austropuccinia psidii MF-1]|uniref:Uncharacterized protein n=1 Tax=Austropuccinia psidii MF-1 TaxID=1389203 RepID=A0A9Q3INB0_9BASI|nr:hypothetical protein [Austropuccinia psidii MF-1]
MPSLSCLNAAGSLSYTAVDLLITTINGSLAVPSSHIISPIGLCPTSLIFVLQISFLEEPETSKPLPKMKMTTLFVTLAALTGSYAAPTLGLVGAALNGLLGGGLPYGYGVPYGYGAAPYPPRYAYPPVGYAASPPPPPPAQPAAAPLAASSYESSSSVTTTSSS